MKLQNKMFIQHTLTIIMLLLAMYIIVNYTLNKSMLERETQTLDQYFTLHRIETLKLINDQKINVEQLFTGQYAPFIASHLSSNSNFQVQLFNQEETIVGSSDKELMLKREDIKSALSGKISTIIVEENDNRYFIYSAPLSYKGEIIGGIRYILNLEQHDATIAEMRLWFIAVACACLIIAVLAGYSFSNALLKPLYELKLALKKVATGDFSFKVRQRSKDEIGEITNDFNTMSDNLVHHIALLEYEQDKQKNFYDHVTHELKTPLTSIIGFSNLIEKVNSLEEIRNCNHYIHKESTKLLDMVEELLHTSLMQNDVWNIKRKYINLADLTEECVQILKPTLEKSAISLRVIKQPSVVYIDPVRTQQVIFNIIDNAIKHSECTEIKIELNEDKENIIMKVKDNGKGMSHEKLQRIFKAKTKKNQVVTPNSHGLGMPIVKQLMELQGGAVQITSEEKIGTIVTLYFAKPEQ